jgi:rRNA maturation protein Nop10
MTLLAVLFGLIATVIAAEAQESGPSTAPKVSRWESNLSAGAVIDRRIGIVKSIWWFAVPKVVALGPSFEFVGPFLSFSVGVAVTAPIPVVTPFVCASAGASLTQGGITSYGGGLKVRLGPKFGIIVEYRKYRYTLERAFETGPHETVVADYVGAGISWKY